MLAVDPGGCTGMALYEAGDLDEHFEAWSEPDPMGAIDRARMEIVSGLDVLVVEEFRITAGTGRKTRAGSNTAIEIIGALRWIAFKRGVPIVEQAPADAMGFATNDKLKRLGWYTPGPDHARDATRHLVLYLVKGGRIEPSRVVGD